MESRLIRAIGAIALAAALLALLAACRGPDTVVIATVDNYHPFAFVNDEGEIDGLERELGTSCAGAPTLGASGS